MKPSAAMAVSAPLRIFVLAASFASVVAAHACLIGYKTYANVDEGYAAALASRLLDGHKLYQGAISQRGPLMYYTFEALGALCGWDNIVALRIFALLLALAHVYLVYWAGRKLLSDAAAVVGTIVTAYALSFGFPPEDAIAVNGETLQLPALVVAVVLGATAMRHQMLSRGRVVRLFVCGLLLGVAVSIKQSIILHPAIIVLWIAIDAHRRRAPLKAAALETCVLGVGVLLVPAAFAIHAAMQGTLKDLYYYTVTYNRDVHMRPTTRHFKWLPWVFFRLISQTAFPMFSVLLSASWLPYLGRRVKAAWTARSGWALARGFGPRQYLALHFLVAFASATAMWRFFPHYYIQSFPFFALCLGAAVDALFRRRAFARGARSMTWGFGAFTMLTAGIGCDFAERADGRVSHDESVTTMARVIQATTKPDDRIFVWGFSSWLYGYAHRKPAGRYVFETYVTGFVPWYWEKLQVERARIVPGSQEALLDDLEREKPAVVVDAGSIMMARPMRLYGAFSELLHRDYCFDMRIGALDLYRRKTGPCATPWYPRPFDAIDYQGRVLGIPMPDVVDGAQTRRLPRGSFVKPIYFLDGPKPIGLEATLDAKREREEREGAAEGFYIPDLEP